MQGLNNVRRRENLDRLLAPRHIVFMGGERATWAIKTCRDAGYAGGMFAVHPKKAEIEGIACARRVRDLPVAPDAAFIAVPADGTIEVLGELNAMGAGGGVCYAAGFAEMGEEGRARNEALIHAAGDLAVVGPNCFGVINYVTNGSLWSVPYTQNPAHKGVAVIGQSGNLCINLSMSQREVPFSYIISAGNQAVLGFEDYIDALVDNPNVTAIGLFLEGIRDVRRFAAACTKALEARKPIAALRVGISELGARVAASHTNSLAGQNELYDTLFERLGILATKSVPQFLELLKALSIGRFPNGRRLAVFSSSGGDNGLAADAASVAGFDLPPPKAAPAAAIQGLLPSYGAASNPLDFTAGYWGQEQLLTPMFTHMLTDDQYDVAALVIDHPRGRHFEGYDPPMASMVQALAAAAATTGVPAAVVSVNPESMPEPMRRVALDSGLMPLQGLHDAFDVLGQCVRYREFVSRTAIDGLPPLPAGPASSGEGRRAVDEAESKARLAAFGLPVPDSQIVDARAIAHLAIPFPGPYSLKAVSSDLPHKTEAGAVVLNLPDTNAVARTANEMAARIAKTHPDLRITRFLVEPMISGALAELIIGIKVDSHFGPVLVVGAGGVYVELLGDAQRLLLPTSRQAIEKALRQLRIFRLLNGYRGRPKADTEALVDAIEAVIGYTMAHLDTVEEIDVNPIMILPEGRGAVAVDALIIEANPKGGVRVSEDTRHGGSAASRKPKKIGT